MTFDEFLKKEIAPWLKARSFRRQGHRFTRQVRGNHQVIDFTPGRFNTQFDFRFGVSVGVYYGVMREFDEFPSKADSPSEAACHWRSACMQEPLTFDFVIRTRPGAFGPATAGDEVERWGYEIRSWLENRGLPLLDRNVDDSAAMESWRRGPVDGLHETRRLEWLAIDLARRGASAELTETLDKLELVAAQLRQLGADSTDPFVARIEETETRARKIAGLS